MAYEWTFINDLRTVPLNTKERCIVYDYAGKPDLSKSYWISKIICGLIMYLTEVIKQQ